MAWMKLLASAALCAGALAAPSASPRVLHEKRTAPSTLRQERVDGDAIIPIRIALKQTNLETGYDRLMDVADPKSTNFGKHLSAAEVHDIFAPTLETLDTVRDWLIQSGIKAADIIEYETRGWLAVDMPASHAERLFEAEYYEHHSEKDVKIGCDSYTLPAHISNHVDFIKPGVKFSSPLKKRTLEARSEPHGYHGSHYPHPQWLPPNPFPYDLPEAVLSLPTELQTCAVNITPICIFALYDLPPPTFGSLFPNPANELGLYETYDAFSVEDLQLTFANFTYWVPPTAIPKVISVDGGVAPVAPGDPRNGGESDIDIYLSTSIIYPQKVVVYQVDDPYVAAGGENNTGFLNEFLDAVDGSYCNYTAYGITGDSPGIDPTYPDPVAGGYNGTLQCGTYSLTKVLSVSYGEAEANFPRAYVERQCNEFMKLGLQGHSIFIASGDYGVASFPGSDGDEYGCLSADGLEGKIYNPDYPSGCPYLTAVGGTRLYPNDTVFSRESVMQVNLTAFNIETGIGSADPTLQFFASGGGFSNFFTPPSYQAAAVSSYLEKYSPAGVPSYVANASGTNYGENGGVYNRAGRGYPDVAANGAFLQTINNLTEVRFFGTSLASPIFASTINLINEARLKIGKGPVGFVNPTLYSHPYVLNDITNGSNPNCGSSGFTAEAGWDPVTGLGTPNYPKMLALFLSLP